MMEEEFESYDLSGVSIPDGISGYDLEDGELVEFYDFTNSFLASDEDYAELAAEQKKKFLELILDRQIEMETESLNMPHVVVITDKSDPSRPLVTVAGPYPGFLQAFMAADRQIQEQERCGDLEVTYSVTSLRDPSYLEVPTD